MKEYRPHVNLVLRFELPHLIYASQHNQVANQSSEVGILIIIFIIKKHCHWVCSSNNQCLVILKVRMRAALGPLEYLGT